MVVCFNMYGIYTFANTYTNKHRNEPVAFVCIVKCAGDAKNDATSIQLVRFVSRSFEFEQPNKMDQPGTSTGIYSFYRISFYRFRCDFFFVCVLYQFHICGHRRTKLVKNRKNSYSKTICLIFINKTKNSICR